MTCDPHNIRQKRKLFVHNIHIIFYPSSSRSLHRRVCMLLLVCGRVNWFVRLESTGGMGDGGAGGSSGGLALAAAETVMLLLLVHRTFLLCWITG